MKKTDIEFPDFSWIIEISDKRIEKHLKKFKWEWLKKLIFKWTDFYYEKYWNWQKKHEFINLFYKDILKYINSYFETDIDVIFNDSRNIQMILDKYNELIYDWENNNPIQNRREEIVKTTENIIDKK